MRAELAQQRGAKRVNRPPLDPAAASPNRASSRWAISPAALFVNVNAQMRPGSTPRPSIRKPMRSVRQYVLPAPGPASTSRDSGLAWMASRCDGDAA